MGWAQWAPQMLSEVVSRSASINAAVTQLISSASIAAARCLNLRKPPRLLELRTPALLLRFVIEPCLSAFSFMHVVILTGRFFHLRAHQPPSQSPAFFGAPGSATGRLCESEASLRLRTGC